MSLINRAVIARTLIPGMRAIFGLYDTYKDQWRSIFKVYKSDKAQEMDMEMIYPGYADFKEEGQPISMASLGQGSVTNYFHKSVGLSFPITKEALADNQYKSQFPKEAVGLRESLRATKDVLGANVLNNAFNYDALRGDGQPLCSVSHPIVGGVYANTFPQGVTADLSETSAEQVVVMVQSFPMLSGMLSQTRIRKLFVHPKEQFTASRIFNSSFRPGVDSNDINALKYGNYLPEGFEVNQYLNSRKAHFYLTDAPEGMKHFERESIQLGSHVDDLTHTITFQAYERYSFGCSNPRAIFGIAGV